MRKPGTVWLSLDPYVAEFKALSRQAENSAALEHFVFRMGRVLQFADLEKDQLSEAKNLYRTAALRLGIKPIHIKEMEAIGDRVYRYGLKNPNPPKAGDKLISLLYSEDKSEEIIGDLQESYKNMLLNRGIIWARAHYFWEVSALIGRRCVRWLINIATLGGAVESIYRWFT